MAKVSMPAALAAAAALAALWAPAALLFQVVGQAPGPRVSTRPSGARLRGHGGADAAGEPRLGGAATAAALGVAALAAGRLLAGRTRGQRTAAARCAEGSFAAGLVGGESALGGDGYNFDPLGCAAKCEKFLPWFREAELKHGRICMLAWIGLVVPDFARIPGPEACYTASVINAHKACVGEDQLGPLFQVFMFCGVVEMLTTFPKITQGLMTLEGAGDYQLGAQFLPNDAEQAKAMKLKELKNGRLAMVAFGGAITQAVLSGNSFPWVYAEKREGRQRPAASILAAGAPGAQRAAAGVARRAQDGYKMSKSVPFLPVSPALEGYVGEEDGFDPLGFTLALDIRWLREAELKHARVAMLATVGWIATDLGMRVPGEAFQVSTVDAHDAMVKFGSMSQMLVWIGYAEFFGFLAITNMLEGKTDRKPGDFALRVLAPKDEQGFYDMQLKELRNGRLAMLAFGGLATQAVLTGKTFPFFATGNERSTAAPSASGSALCGGLQGARAGGAVAARALETSKSLPFLPKPQNLKGYVGEEIEFDPLGFSDTFDMKWLREAELKHGRVCMLATVGFYTQQYVTFPGMDPTPDALNAVYTGTAQLGWLIAIAGFVEYWSYGGKITMLDMFEDEAKVPGDFDFGSGFLKGKSAKDVADMKLKELNNGRLAMFALGGMVHHNLVVKGPLFPMFPDGWEGPQGTWELDSVTGRLVNNQVGGL